MLSIPAAADEVIPPAPCACAITFRPSEWAVSAMLCSSGLVKWPSSPRACCDKTPPVAVILMTSAPAREALRTFSAHSSGPVQV
jgi:hypothetical protein